MFVIIFYFITKLENIQSVVLPGSNKNYTVDRQLNFTSNAIFLSISIKRNVNSLPTVPPPRYLSLHSEWVIYKVQENIFDRKVLHETI